MIDDRNWKSNRSFAALASVVFLIIAGAFSDGRLAWSQELEKAELDTGLAIHQWQVSPTGKTIVVWQTVNGSPNPRDKTLNKLVLIDAEKMKVLESKELDKAISSIAINDKYVVVFFQGSQMIQRYSLSDLDSAKRLMLPELAKRGRIDEAGHLWTEKTGVGLVDVENFRFLKDFPRTQMRGLGRRVVSQGVLYPGVSTNGLYFYETATGKLLGTRTNLPGLTTLQLSRFNGMNRELPVITHLGRQVRGQQLSDSHEIRIKSFSFPIQQSMTLPIAAGVGIPLSERVENPELKMQRLVVVGSAMGETIASLELFEKDRRSFGSFAGAELRLIHNRIFIRRGTSKIIKVELPERLSQNLAMPLHLKLPDQFLIDANRVSRINVDAEGGKGLKFSIDIDSPLLVCNPESGELTVDGPGIIKRLQQESSNQNFREGATIHWANERSGNATNPILELPPQKAGINLPFRLAVEGEDGQRNTLYFNFVLLIDSKTMDKILKSRIEKRNQQILEAQKRREEMRNRGRPNSAPRVTRTQSKINSLERQLERIENSLNEILKLIERRSGK